MSEIDLLRISPEIAVLATAVVVILADLGIGDKKTLAILSVAGMVVAIGLSTYLLQPELQGTAFDGVVSVDSFAIIFKYLFLGIGILIVVGASNFASRFKEHEGEYYALLLTAITGMMFMASSREFITLYISLELTAISLYVLAAFMRDGRSSEAGLKYLLLGAISSAVMLYGIALVYGTSGSTFLSEIAAGSPSANEANYPVLLLGIVFIIAGFGFKIAAFPFQMWVPDVYEGAPTPVTAFLSVASKSAGFAIIIRVFYEAFGPQASDWSLLWAVIAAFSMTMGNLAAIAQNNIKRMLGYSSIAQAGYVLIGVASINAGGPAGVLFFLVSYSLTNLLAFIAIMAISGRIKSDRIDDFAGMGKRAPWLAALLAFAMISLIGIPPTGGFFGKIYIFSAGVEAELVWLVVVGVINSVISAYYYLRVVKVMFVDAPAAGEESESAIHGTLAQYVVVGAAAAGVLLLGLVPSVLYSLTQAGATPFFG